jgi:hypothetical protein
VLLHRKKKASEGAANQVFVVVAKYTGTAPTASASGKSAARTVTQIKALVCLNHPNLKKLLSPFGNFISSHDGG